MYQTSSFKSYQFFFLYRESSCPALTTPAVSTTELVATANLQLGLSHLWATTSGEENCCRRHLQTPSAEAPLAGGSTDMGVNSPQLDQIHSGIHCWKWGSWDPFRARSVVGKAPHCSAPGHGSSSSTSRAHFYSPGAAVDGKTAAHGGAGALLAKMQPKWVQGQMRWPGLWLLQGVKQLASLRLCRDSQTGKKRKAHNHRNNCWGISEGLCCRVFSESHNKRK